MDDGGYYRLASSCIDHFLQVLGPGLDKWAEGKARRWRERARRDDEQEGRAHWQFDDFEDFRKLFEGNMAVFLREENCTQADFNDVLTRAHAEGGPPGTESLGSLFLDIMTSIDDFESFANFMDKKAGDDSSDDDDSGDGADDDDRSNGAEGKQAGDHDAARSRRK